MEKESLKINPNPEEVKAIKKEAIKLITERINRGDEFLYISEGHASGNGEAALMIGGNTNNLARVLSLTMSKVPQLHEIVTTAVEAHNYANSREGIMGTLKDMLTNLKDSLDCNNCDKKDECKIKNDSMVKSQGDC
jgi:hypothetical protein